MPNNYNTITDLFTKNSLDQTNTFNRLNGIPLDKTSIYNSFSEAATYAKDSGSAYVGQIIAVITDNDAQAYIITPTAQEDGSYLRPIADLSEIEKQLEDLDEKIDNHQEVQLAHELGDSEDSSYSIKVDSNGNLCIIKNNANGTTNSLVIGSDTVKAQHSKTVEEDPIIFPVGQLNTLPINDTDKFKNIEELDADMLPEENRGAKVQQLFKERQLTTGGIFYDCPTFKQNESKFGIKFVIDDAGNGHVDLDYSVNSLFDITYDPETMKIVRFGDFYFHIVYDATNKPIGALCIGRPEGVLTGSNYAASWRYFSTNTKKTAVSYYTNGNNYPNSPSGTFDLNNANLDNKYGVDEYGRQWIPRINDLEKNNTYAMSPLPVVQFAKQQTNNGPAANNGAGVTLKALTTDNQFAPVYGWGSPTVIYQLFSYDRTVEINETETKTETRYYIILASNNGKVTTTPITNYQFTLGSTTYEISKDCTKIILSGQNLITSNILESFDLLKIFNGKGPLLSAKDEYALPSSSINLWGSYWLKDPTKPDRQNYDIRVGVFDPDEASYEYKVDAKGTKSAEKLNPAGNYSIGKLENFHPLRINMTGDPKVDELYIRTATIKGFKTTMDWPNASAVAPRDCSLRSGTVWVQFIWAYPVKEDKPRLFFRVLFDGYVNTAEYKDLVGTYRYPWSPCYELTNIGAVEEAKKYTDEAITQAISELEIPEMPEVIYTEVQQADTDVLGGIKTGYEQNDKNYPVKLDDAGKAFVEVPWTDTNTTYTEATETSTGLMSAEDKSKLAKGLNADGQVQNLKSAYLTMNLTGLGPSQAVTITHVTGHMSFLYLGYDNIIGQSINAKTFSELISLGSLIPLNGVINYTCNGYSYHRIINRLTVDETNAIDFYGDTYIVDVDNTMKLAVSDDTAGAFMIPGAVTFETSYGSVIKGSLNN